MKDGTKKKLMTTWRIIIVIGMIAITSLAIVVFYKLYQDSRYSYRNRKHTVSSAFSDAYKFEYYKGRVRTKDAVTGEYLSPQMTDIFIDNHINDTLTVFFDGDKRGFLNIYTGEATIPAQFERAWIFSEGLGGVVKDGKLGFANRKGELAISCKFNYSYEWRDRVDFVFKGGYCTVIGEDGKHGLIDKTGEWAIEPQYDYINKSMGGYRIVCDNGKYGVLDRSLRMVLPVDYDWIVVREDGFIVRREGEQKLLALDGQTVLIPVIYDGVYYFTYGTEKVDTEGNIVNANSEYMAYKICNKWGILDKNGRPITKAVYESVDALKNDLFSCEISDDCYIIINGRGEMVK